MEAIVVEDILTVEGEDVGEGNSSGHSQGAGHGRRSEKYKLLLFRSIIEPFD